MQAHQTPSRLNKTFGSENLRTNVLVKTQETKVLVRTNLGNQGGRLSKGNSEFLVFARGGQEVMGVGMHARVHAQTNVLNHILSTGRSCNTLDFGNYGLKATEPDRLTARQIEAARRALTREMKRVGKVWIRIFPDKPISQKPAEVRMGSGKGNPERWVAVVRPGRVLFELTYPDEETARGALNRAIQKLPIKARVISREEAI
mgnify:CR=1 FL=1